MGCCTTLGPVAEGLGRALQKLPHQFESGRDLHQPTALSFERVFYAMKSLPRYLHFVGLLAAVALIVSCFLPWTYHADIDQSFTGFYSYKNHYGKPGKFVVLSGTLCLLGLLIPRVWAKRIILFVAALNVGYAIKTYILFTSCYNNYCPEKQIWVFVMLISSVLLLVASIFPDLSLTKKKS